MDEQYVLWEKDIQQFKMKTFQKDLKDVQENRVYRWSHGFGKQKAPQRFPSISSLSSIGRNSTSSAYDVGQKLRSSKLKNATAARGGNNKRKPAHTTTTKLQVIHLPDISLSEAQVEVLGPGLNFSPSFTAIKYLHLFARCLMLKKWHDKPSGELHQWSEEEQKAVNILEELED